MTEQDFRQALRGAMAASNPPPPMSCTAMVRVARQARVRRRFAWTGAGSAVLAATVAVGASLLSGTPAANGLAAGGPPPSRYPTPPVMPSGTAEPFPTGPDGLPQQDRTATAGVRYQQGVKLLDALVKVVPAGYTAGDGSHQAEFADRIKGVDVWDYTASVAVLKGGRTGTLAATVYTVGNTLTGDPCDLAMRFWVSPGGCQLLLVGTAQVGVAVAADGDRRLDQWAVYRQPDGVVVFIGQAQHYDDPGGPALPALPLTAAQLAGLATDERFHLG
jgi:hypothetical protein